MQKVEAAVKEVFGPLNPREDIPLERLSALILEVRKKVEGATPEERKYEPKYTDPKPFISTNPSTRNRRWLPYLLPPPESEDLVLRESGTIPSPSPPTQSSLPSPPTSPSPPSHPSTSTSSPSPPPLRRLLDETSDLIDSPPFSQVLTHTLDATFSHLTDTKIRTQAYKLPSLSPSSPPTSPSARITEITDTDPLAARAKLATILAVVTKQAHAIGSGLPNEYVQAMEGVGELEAFGAVVFSERFEDDVKVRTPPEADGESREDGEEVAGAEVEAGVGEEVEAGLEPVDEGGVVDRAWRGFEGVWGRVVGMRGVDEGEGPVMTG